MGVYSKEYVMMGYDLIATTKEMNDDQLDAFLEEMEELADNKGLTFIYDGMSGEYCFLGKVLNQGNSGEGMPIVKYYVNELDKLQNEVHKAVKELKLPQLPALYSFTDWY
jgi:hypothetical protein